MQIPVIGGLLFRGVNLPPLNIEYSPNKSSRRGTHVDVVVVHDTEGSYAGAVSWLKNPKAQASAHVIVKEDGSEATQIVGWEEKAWSCVDYNSRSDNIELAGFAAKPYPKAQLDVAARIVAFRLKKRGLRPAHGIGGFLYHSDLGAAGGGHHDPGFSDSQRKYFEDRVKKEFIRSHFRDQWGVSFVPEV